MKIMFGVPYNYDKNMNRTCTCSNTSANRDTIMWNLLFENYKKIEILETVGHQPMSINGYVFSYVQRFRPIGPCPSMDYVYAKKNIIGIHSF